MLSTYTGLYLCDHTGLFSMCINRSIIQSKEETQAFVYSGKFHMVKLQILIHWFCSFKKKYTASYVFS